MLVRLATPTVLESAAGRPFERPVPRKCGPFTTSAKRWQGSYCMIPAAVAIAAGVRPRSRTTLRAVATAPSTVNRVSSPRSLVSGVRVLSVQQHPGSPSQLDVVRVEDPEFVGMSLQVVVPAGLWQSGDTGLLLAVGSTVPPSVLEKAGYADVLKLAMKQGQLEAPLAVNNVASQGLLVALDSLDRSPNEEEGGSSSSQVHGIPIFQNRVCIRLGFLGGDFSGSSGADQSVEAVLRKALLQAGVVPSGLKPPFLRLSRTDKGVHARMFCLSPPLLKLRANDLRPDGSCPGLRLALNQRLPSSLRVLEVSRLPFNADLSSVCTSREYRYYLPRRMLGGGERPDPQSELVLANLLGQLAVGEQCFLNFTRPELNAGVDQELRRTEEGEKWLQKMCGHKRRRRLAVFPPDSRRDSELPPVPEIARSMTVRQLLQSELLLVRSKKAEGPLKASAEEDEHLFESGPAEWQQAVPVTKATLSSEIGMDPEALLCVRLVGSGFLTQMVRLLVGSACAVAVGNLEPEEFEAALAAEEVVDLTEFMAPPLGLVLHEQHIDKGAAPWLVSESASSAADAWLYSRVLPSLQRAWNASPLRGNWLSQTAVTWAS